MYTGREYTHPLDGRVGGEQRSAKIDLTTLWVLGVALLAGLTVAAIYGWTKYAQIARIYRAAVEARSVVEYEPLATTADKEGDCPDGQCPTRGKVLGKLRSWRDRH